jgi:hypothetical protein
MGGNHGPWWITPQGPLILYSLTFLVLLIPVTLVVGAARAWARRRVRPLVTSLALVLVQVALAAGQVYFVFWTID